MIVASAPGKLVLGGEYAVLEGAPAIVAAVQVRATVRLGEAGDATLPPEVEATRAWLAARHGDVPGELSIDVAALRAGDRKLGVGSSAAAAVAAAAVLRSARGAELDDDGLAIVFEAALLGHRAVAPRGSGVDVAASTYGGIARFELTSGLPRLRALAFPAGLFASVVYTGKEARTSAFLDRVDALRVRDEAAHRAALDRLGAAARAFASAFEAGDVALLLAATSEHHEAMGALGRAIGAEVVEDTLAAVAALATAHGGASKPSGAGGGDVAIAFFADEAARASFETACRDQGFRVLDVALGGPGVRLHATRADPSAMR